MTGLRCLNKNRNQYETMASILGSQTITFDDDGLMLFGEKRYKIDFISVDSGGDSVIHVSDTGKLRVMKQEVLEIDDKKIRQLVVSEISNAFAVMGNSDTLMKYYDYLCKRGLYK